MTPTARTIRHLNELGWTTALVERWNPHARIRQDLFSFADVLAMKEGEHPLLVQVTSGSNLSSRVAKILATPEAQTAIRAGFRIEAHGWRKLKVRRGGKAVRWTPKIVPISKEDFLKCHEPSPGCPSGSRSPTAGDRPTALSSV